MIAVEASRLDSMVGWLPLALYAADARLSNPCGHDTARRCRVSQSCMKTSILGPTEFESMT